jgi:hypothetical protein
MRRKHQRDNNLSVVLHENVFGFRPLITIARYSAAITSGLRHAGDCRRGGIAGRWTKPVAAPGVCDVASEVRSLSQPQLGELYPGSLVAANVD